jgi:hypothetical protein
MRDTKFRNFVLAQGPFGVGGDVSIPEVKAFLGLIINMGLIALLDTKGYWSSENKTQIKFFGDIMSRDRFLQMLQDYWSSENKTQIKFFGDIMSRDRFLQIFWMMYVGK